MNRSFSRLLAIAGLILALGGSAFAQNTTVTQTAQKADAAAFLQAQVGGATTCATVNTTVANATVSITPPAGNYVYITGVYIDIVSDITGATQVATLSTTNLTGGPIWSLALIIPTANSSGQFRQIADTFPTALKSTVAGTAVTFVPSAQLAHSIECIRVAGFFAPL